MKVLSSLNSTNVLACKYSMQVRNCFTLDSGKTSLNTSHKRRLAGLLLLAPGHYLPIAALSLRLIILDLNVVSLHFISNQIMRKATLLAIIATLFSNTLLAQVSYTANDSVAKPPTLFRPGYNSGFAAGWSDLSIATMATGDPSQFVRGSGLYTNRDALFFEALETQGYNSKLSEVQHYLALGQGSLTALTLGGEDGFKPEPPAPYRDTTHYCPNKQSTLFANLYLPIWDGGANGTPYHDANYYAAYMYKTVNMYKDYIQYWEIWNEPGFDFSGNRGWREPGDPVGNWWDADPNPCDYKLHAPVQHYVRMLRISWEIIKTLDPTAHVCLGAPGFPSFVDAVARNTDNPNGGTVTAQYPLRGGAYFDAVAYHAFPHIDGSFIVDRSTGQVLRNSDRGAEGVIQLKRQFEAVLDKYGYNGNQYPRKHYIITEINLPRKIFNYTPSTYGGQVPQRNFMMKAYLECKKEGIGVMNVYTFGELLSEANATTEFDLMGLYLNMDNTNYYTAIQTDAGIGVKTMSDLIYNTQHDPVKSAQLQNNPNVRIEAFKRPDGKYVYVLWAKMQQDFNELGTAEYHFPAGSVSPFLKKYYWTHSITAQTFITGNHDILVDGTPMFLVEEPNTGQPLPDFTASSQRFCVTNVVQFQSTAVNANNIRWEFSNGNPASSTSLNPVVTYSTPGFHTVRMIAYGANGDSSVNEQHYYIHARTAPTAIFYESVIGGNVFFLNGTFDADSVHWDFGDGTTSTDKFPAHVYAFNGNYLVTLTAVNPCGTTVYQDTVKIEYALEIYMNIAPSSGCKPLTVQYQATSPLATSFKWIFPGGTANSDTVPNPIVVYDSAGVFSASLTVANSLTSATQTRNNVVTVLDVPGALNAQITQIQNLTVKLSASAAGATQYFWDFGDGTTASGPNPTHTYATLGVYVIVVTASNPCGQKTFTLQAAVGGSAPVAAFTTSPSQLCAPQQVQFNDQSIGATAWQWTFAGGTPATSSAQNPTITYTAPGTYQVRLITTNLFGADTSIRSITIGGPPVVAFDLLRIDTFTLTGTSLLTNASSVLWLFGDGTFSTEPSITHHYAQPGTYDVWLVGTNACGSDTAFTLVTIAGPAPVAAYTYAPNTGCAPFEVIFQDKSVPTPTSRKWTFAGGTPATSTDPSPVVTYNIPGHYPVQLIVQNQWGSDTILQTNQVFVGTVPSANFTYVINNSTVTFTNQSVNENAVLWTFGDGTSSTLSDPVHVYVPGTYTVTLSASNACGAAFYEQMITITSSTDQPESDLAAVSLSPNPANTEVRFSNLKPDQIYSIEILDAIGRTQITQVVSYDAPTISVQSLSKGSYQCVLRDRSGNYRVISFVVQR